MQGAARINTSGLFRDVPASASEPPFVLLLAQIDRAFEAWMRKWNGIIYLSLSQYLVTTPDTTEMTSLYHCSQWKLMMTSTRSHQNLVSSTIAFRRTLSVLYTPIECRFSFFNVRSSMLVMYFRISDVRRLRLV